MKIFPIENLRIEQVRLDPNNVFRHSDQQQQRLVGVIQEHGNLSVICVDVNSKEDRRIELHGETEVLPTYELVGGEARLEAYRAAGAEVVPVIMAEFDSKAQRDAAAIALNSRFGEFDEKALDQLLIDLANEGYDLDLTGLEPYRYEDIGDLIGSTPNLDDLASEFGESGDDADWATIELKVPPEVKDDFDDLMGNYEGEPHERFAALLGAIRANQLLAT